MAIILEDSNLVLWSVSIAGGQINTVQVESGVPVTVLLNDPSGASWNLEITTAGVLDPVSIAAGSYPPNIAIDSSHFLSIATGGSKILVWSLYTPSITVDAVIDALGAFIQPFVGAAQIIRGQVNRVAPPIGSFVELTEILQCDLEYPVNWYDSINLQRQIIGPKRIVIQADFYGPESGDWCSAVKTVFRSPYAASQFPNGIAPLYTDDGHETPLLTGEQQYERRWVLTCSLQFSPVVIVPQQSANTLEMNIVYDAQEVIP
jgi:hypothetical protein